MADVDIIKQLRQQGPAQPKVPTASNLILIDNYDSFTYNVYQYLVLEGATVTVFRNDEITLEELIAKNPTQLVLSPGPGHPRDDAGISTEAIKHFAGKIPILGVCMGEQCIISAFGGVVDVTGEILHGKTSPLSHDGKGVYRGVDSNPAQLPVTRYHSLAGTHATLPDCLEISSWISGGPDGGKGIIMGVRHKEFVIEGVQFHPESILSADGRKMFQNFLAMKGGKWSDNALPAAPTTKASSTIVSNGTPSASERWSGQSILATIYRNRSDQVATQKLVPSLRPEDLQECYDLGLAPPQISFPDRLRQSPYTLCLLAEIKRASPSKGEIAMHISAPAQARKYAIAGASAISVLTEPTWFKGSVDDLRAVRQSLNGMPNRPALLRKEFVFDKYQILEARLAGADTVLLIVKMLDDDLLKQLYDYSLSLGMEPLVEVNTGDEMKRALALGSKVIGVNNRDLTNFEVDLDTTSRLMATVPPDTMVLALSGISGSADVEAYRKNGVGGVLVGEALMRAPDVTTWVSDTLGVPHESAMNQPKQELLVKICGTRTPEAAKAAIEAGADLIGIILVEGRSRCVPPSDAVKIASVVHGTIRPHDPVTSDLDVSSYSKAKDFFTQSVQNLTFRHRALLVGVFQNQSLSYILRNVQLLGLDVVQLHGNEPIEWASLIPVPVIKRFAVSDPAMLTRGFHSLPLVDSAQGGTGTLIDQESVKLRLESESDVRAILAGGLNPDNVAQILEAYGSTRSQIAAVDVSSGVETKGKQDLEKIRRFIQQAKSV